MDIPVHIAMLLGPSIRGRPHQIQSRQVHMHQIHIRYWRSRPALFAPLLRKWFALCTFAALLWTPSLPAQQRSSSASTTPIWPLHSSAPDHALPDAVGPQPATAPLPDRDESCLLWTVVTASDSTVKAATLQVPGEARSEFKKGCSDLRGKKFASAETHLRKAVANYPKYSVAWVLLGQVLENNNHMEEARTACSKASGADAEYAPAYLCLADIAGQQQRWEHALELADRALTLDPTAGVYGHFYCAMAQFHLNQLSAAEKNAQASLDADHLHRLPQTHLLLAQIYATERDAPRAAMQLRAYLTAAPNSPDAAELRKKLAEIESPSAK
jgi:tetratricopeptide (TPR) repeat protein